MTQNILSKSNNVKKDAFKWQLYIDVNNLTNVLKFLKYIYFKIFELHFLIAFQRCQCFNIFCKMSVSSSVKNTFNAYLPDST